MASDKPPLRKTYLARRQSIGGRDAAVHAEFVARRTLPLLAGCVCVAGYAATRGELDVSGLLGLLSERGIITALPCMADANVPLVFRAWKPGEKLIPGAYGIGEPSAASPLVDPDVLLVPLLAFDRRGHRLGYGGGYYDRTLARLRERASLRLAIGMAYSVQEISFVPEAGHDQRLDVVVTEKEVIDTRAAG